MLFVGWIFAYKVRMEKRKADRAGQWQATILPCDQRWKVKLPLDLPFPDKRWSSHTEEYQSTSTWISRYGDWGDIFPVLLESPPHAPHVHAGIDWLAKVLLLFFKGTPRATHNYDHWHYDYYIIQATSYFIYQGKVPYLTPYWTYF